nr:hypothetical protein HK105_007740 [Polyrhizophydium stewartii]
MPTNINIGVLGHVDAGKTALVRALSTQGSTASFECAPPAGLRLTPLRNSILTIPHARPELTGKCTKVRLRLPATLTVSEPGVESDKLQVTWVDCPGHASLVRTVLASVRIIDMALVVVDATKGFQTQTGESLVLCELATSHVIIVLSKVDLLPQQERMAAIEKITARVRKTLSKTKFADASIVPTTVKPSGEMSDAEKALYAPDAVTKCISKLASVPVRSPDGPFLCLIDHCFLIKGQGTIATGTVIGGSVRVGDMVEIPVLGVSKKVKSIQVFRRPVKHAQQGDRALRDVDDALIRVTARSLIHNQILDANTVLVEGAFNSKSAVLAFADKPVVLLQGQIRGTIQSPFGLSGKFKAFFTGGHMLPLDGRHDPAMVEIRYAKVGMY